DRGALGQGGGHDEVLGAGVRGGVEVEGGAGQPGRLDVDDRLALVDDRAQALVAEVVEVEVAAAEVAAADALDDGLAEAVHQRGGEQHRPAEPAGDLGGQHGAGEAGGVDDERALGLVQLDVGAHGLGQLDRAAYVLDDRDVAQDGAAFGREQSRPDHRQHGVLGALDEYGSTQGIATAYAVTDHSSGSLGFQT